MHGCRITGHSKSYIIMVEQIKIDRAKQRRTRHQLESPDYFNAGLLLMNLRLMREKDASSVLMQFVRDNPDLIYFQDQDAWNTVFNGKVMELPNRFNFHDFALDYSVESVPCGFTAVRRDGPWRWTARIWHDARLPCRRGCIK